MTLIKSFKGFVLESHHEEDGWYYGIAVDGYLVLTDDPRAQQNIVFFPAFPMATRVVGRLLGGSAPAFIAAGTIVAQLPPIVIPPQWYALFYMWFPSSSSAWFSMNMLEYGYYER